MESSNQSTSTEKDEKGLAEDDDSNDENYRVRVWDKGHYGEDGGPSETIPLEASSPHLWQDDPYYDSGTAAFDIHPDDLPATLYIYTNDSVRKPPVGEYIDTSFWDGPVESGLPFDNEYDGETPFGCQVWGRVLLVVEDGLTR